MFVNKPILIFVSFIYQNANINDSEVEDERWKVSHPDLITDDVGFGSEDMSPSESSEVESGDDFKEDLIHSSGNEFELEEDENDGHDEKESAGFTSEHKRQGAKDREKKLRAKKRDWENKAARPKGGEKAGKKDKGGFSKTNFKQINRDIKTFVKDPQSQQIILPSMNKLDRKIVHQLALCYNITSKSHGAGTSRCVYLHKRRETRIPSDFRKVDSIIAAAENIRAGGDKSIAKSIKQPKLDKNSSNGGGSAAKPKEYSVVGSEAKPIGDDNTGNAILLKLGWKPGQGLGSSQAGMTEPVSVIYKSSRRGLD